jgi:hypothetical protein
MKSTLGRCASEKDRGRGRETERRRESENEREIGRIGNR